MNKLTIAIDVDEVCADLITEWLNRYNERTGDNLKPTDIHSWDIAQYAKRMPRDEFYSILREPTLYHAILPFPDALPAVQELRAMGHRVIFVTSCGLGTMDQKLKWLMREGFLEMSLHPSKDFYAAADKSMIRADVLFDDYHKNIEAFPEWGILVQRPHNLNVPYSGWGVRGLGAAPALIRTLFKELKY